MKNLILLCCFVLVCCGKYPKDLIAKPYINKDPRKYVYSNPEFSTYTTLYENLTERDVDGVPINFGKMEVEEGNKTTVGQCRAWKIGSLIIYAEIVIKESYWIKASEYAKETLVLHELGHCDLNRKHVEQKSTNEIFTDYEIPVSIMYPYNVGEYWYYELNRDNYLKEMSDYAKGK